jgi:hypothetical protein
VSIGSRSPSESAAELLDRLAGGSPEVKREERGGVVSFLSEGEAFAEQVEGAVRFRLQAPIARAALRTPGTSPIAGRIDWVSLDVSPWDRMTADRVAAWFESARRDALGKRTAR